jgi:MYXO-CTERM domain-containing protein
MRSLPISLAALAFVGSMAATARAHISVSSPTARFMLGSVDQKTGPCGTGTPTGVVTAFEPGQEVTVNWNETVNHPGHFRVALDLTGTDDFTNPTSETDMDVTGNVIAYVPDTGGSIFSHTFTLPDTECSACTLQVIQVMTDKLPWGPSNGDDIYYWCSDISISVGAGSASSTSSTSSGAGAGSASSSGSGAGGSATNMPNPDDEDDGCSIAAAPRPSRTGFSALAMLAFAAALIRRRT